MEILHLKNKLRVFSPPKGSYFLFGPRGTGKSTWIKKHYPDCFYIDLLLPDVLRTYATHPEYLKKVLDAQVGVPVVVIDEIQKIPNLLSVVHAVIEEKRDIQFILTGSSARKLKQAGVDLLAGRAIKRAMHPFLAVELGDAFKLEEALKLGMLPLVWGAQDPEEVLESYVNLYIQEEVQFEGLVRNVGSFFRFLSVIAFSHANILNTTNIARECEVKRNTVENYLEILQDLLLACVIPVFTQRAQRALMAHPKFYLFDAGIFRVLSRSGPLDNAYEVSGMALEGLVLQHLRAWCDYSKGRFQIFYWRTKAGLEVDFVVYGEEAFWAIEVKNSTKIFPGDVRGLLHFKEDYPECKTLLLYRGQEKIVEKGVLCVPCEEFLKQILPNQPLF
jgi:predicted AAA+ superfamily ATPase